VRLDRDGHVCIPEHLLDGHFATATGALKVLSAAAIELASIAPKLRGSVWYAMYGSDNSYLIEPLLDSLAYDTDGYTRRYAAAALGAFVSDARVKAALEHAQTSDEYEIVRQTAQQALVTDEERTKVVLQRLFDETLSPQERLMSGTTIQEGRNLREVPLTDEAAQAVFDIGVEAAEAEIRSMAWFKLGNTDVYNPSFMSVLVDDLSHHPSDQVRSGAANALRPYVDEPVVREGLERAESDPSFEVRRAVRRALGEISR
jgi:HEAT repeat protein